ncbi:MAG TPA: hypothetical protein V6D12_11330 [Candidatus Obscuribacterales bacterium]
MANFAVNTVVKRYTLPAANVSPTAIQETFTPDKYRLVGRGGWQLQVSCRLAICLISLS